MAIIEKEQLGSSWQNGSHKHRADAQVRARLRGLDRGRNIPYSRSGQAEKTIDMNMQGVLGKPIACERSLSDFDWFRGMWDR